jgi:hypothetical protein
VRGLRAVEWLESLQVSARLIDRTGRVVLTKGWPHETSAAVAPWRVR